MNTKYRNKLKYFLIISLLFISGCAKFGAKLTGDDQLAKAEIEEATGIKASIEELESDVQAQAGAFNELMKQDTESGRDSIINDPELLKYIVMVFGIVVGIPFVGLLVIMAIYILSSERRNKHTSEKFNRLIEAIYNDPKLTKGEYYDKEGA